MREIKNTALRFVPRRSVVVTIHCERRLLLRIDRDCRHVRLHTVVPVQEAFHIDDIACLEGFNSLVDLGILVAEIGINN